MQVFSSIAELRAHLAAQRARGRSIGFAPTMGALHVGHMTLVARARAENDVSVASIFVNPLQFGAGEDFDRYPRTFDADARMLEDGGCDVLFAPRVTDMYPRPMETLVDVPTLGSELEGEVRPGHFQGVCTVVTKLFNIVQPDRAYFGKKDYQQLAIIRRMADDLAQPVEVIGVETVREADGLACSSRNTYLAPEERRAAAIVPRALDEARALIAEGERNPDRLEAQIRAFIETEPLARPEVVALRDPETLRRIEVLGSAALVLLFVRFGATRLLDNAVIPVPTQGARP